MELIFNKGRSGRKGYSLPVLDVPLTDIGEHLPSHFLRKSDLGLPELSEGGVVRHYVNLSVMNHHVDKGFYPLGSCTMKYNPKINEDVSRLPGFAQLHPLQPEDSVQGALQLMYELEEMLREISGMDAVSLQPVAGANSEFTGIMLIRAYHRARGEEHRHKILIPDSAHGTNPASVTVAGFTAVPVKSGEDGLIDVSAVRDAMDDNVAGIMITNPNTLGLFEPNIKEICDVIHEAGGLVYMDGANLNALLGYVRPGDCGVDIVHFNLHKTFSTPHGGGGPGGGGVGVKVPLAPYLPVPRIVERHGHFHLDWDYPESIGKVATFYGNFGVMVKAYTYIRMLGSKGLKRVAENAVINANYLRICLEPYYELPYPGICMHEVVFSGIKQKKEFGVKTLDIAKRLLDYGFHAPTIYFPLIVKEALMIEPTETESKETLDSFVSTMIKIAEECKDAPEVVKSAPHNTPVRRLDDVRAIKQLDVKWRGNG